VYKAAMGCLLLLPLNTLNGFIMSLVIFISKFPSFGGFDDVNHATWHLYKTLASKYAENASNNVSLPQILAKSEICLQMCGNLSIGVISHPFMSSI
jgi:hypothetical protein